MKKKTYLWRIGYEFVLLVTIIGIAFAQVKVFPKIKQEKVPPEVQKIIDETMSGRHGLVNFDAHKVAMGFDKSTKLSDLKAGKAFQVYKIDEDSLFKINENTSLFSAIARPLDIWEVPVLINDTCVTTFEIEKTPHKQQWCAGTFHGCYKDWEKVRETWPESMGYNPILVYSLGKTFFHVPEKDDANLTPLRRRSYDSLAMAADTSFRILMQSKITFRYLKAHLPAKSIGGAK